MVDLRSLAPLDEVPAAAAARLEQDLDRLAAYVSIETPSGDRAALDGLADRVASDLAIARASARIVPLPDGGLLVADLPGRGPLADAAPAVLLTHHDTSHPAGSLLGPVPMVRDGDWFRGPGVHDMKGGLVVAMAALELLRKIDHRPVRLLMVPDEEVGSPTSHTTLLAEAKNAAYVLGFEPPHPDGGLTTARRGSTRWRLETIGRKADAVTDPTSGVNAVSELVDQVLTLRQLLARHPDVLANLGTISGGGRTNVVPDHAWADLGLRFADGAEEQQVLEELAALRPIRLGAHVVSTPLSRRPAWVPSAVNLPLFEKVRAVGLHLGLDLAGRPSPGAADTNLTGAAGIPSIDGLGPLGAGAHTSDERIDIRSVPVRVALTTMVLAGL
jgi:glutamate carboxypeptidase